MKRSRGCMRRYSVCLLWVLLSGFCVSGCGPRSSRLAYGMVSSAQLDKKMEFAVLRAPQIQGVKAAELPVIVVLHGAGDDHRSFDKYGLSDHLRQGMLNGHLPPAHFVLPDGERGFFIDWYDGSHPYETYLLEEVLPAAEALLGVDPARENRHILGVSMGGVAALRIALRFPDRFASGSCLSSLILDEEGLKKLLKSPLLRLLLDPERVFGDGTDREYTDAHNPYVLVKDRAPDLGQKIFIAAGKKDSDRFMETTLAFDDYLTSLGVEHKTVIYDGGHGWDAWIPIIHQAVVYALR